MTGPVQLTAETDPGPELDLPRLRRLARWVLLQEGCRSGDVDILLTDDERIQALNLQYREQDRPTDVLAFGLQEGDASVDFVLPRGERPALGEVVISLPRAREQAAAYGQSCPEEVELLLVHGLLHLLGYDDALDEQRRHMQARQEQLLRAFERRTSLSLSFARAFAGLSDLWWTQRNARLHLTLALAAVLLGLILGLSLPEWALLSLAIAVVLV
ncbi:MAG: rRNA maturation RNase YbeY, partial [Chloroflexia bacterium]|nr:rRNA maturation RNase YbeY [Chloroflexia bacterium]